METLEREAFGFSLPSLPKLRLPSLGRLVGSGDKSKTPKKKTVLADTSKSGGSVLKYGKKGDVTKIMVEVVRVTQKTNGNYKFYLGNGNIWEQIDSKKMYLPRSGAPFMIEIKKATMGSYLLRINGKGAATRIRRNR
ncbi:hypothetical protein MNBD_ALPHA06-67 [hydrothermal vent metagenome]|uniref:Uncharacterized protein n=1 Tax=hydrothermal vent metagenome TaxID=652676 RepID=A0A3B0R6P2_9ZZZZ